MIAYLPIASEETGREKNPRPVRRRFADNRNVVRLLSRSGFGELRHGRSVFLGHEERPGENGLAAADRIADFKVAIGWNDARYATGWSRRQM